jgi:uncharacterized membrane protein YeaQ/YmgE (transglycosylase-associated protein family)
MSWIIAIIVGGIVGWIAYSVTKARMTLFWSVAIGMVGGVSANTGNFFGLQGAGAVTLSVMGILWGIVGAVIALLLVEGIMAMLEDRRKVGTAYHKEVRYHDIKDEEKHNKKM